MKLIAGVVLSFTFLELFHCGPYKENHSSSSWGYNAGVKAGEANSTESNSTIIAETTEAVTWAMPVNQPPTLKHHMKKLAIIAGKVFRYVIPEDLFTDPEEESNLTFSMYEAENVPLSNNSWIQFIPAAREVYGLPLESHVSRWNFVVEAQDSAGLVALGPLQVIVMQHRRARIINHQFTMEFKLLKEYNNAIDWQIRALEGILDVFREPDMDHLTVLNSTQNGDLYEFVWTNDTLWTDSDCPIGVINGLMKIMESDTEAGSPSAGLARAMQPELKVSGVRWRGVVRCADAPPATRAPDTSLPITQIHEFSLVN